MLPAGVRVLVCTTPQDMRRSFDVLAEVVRVGLHENPQSGNLYVFACKRRVRLKVLWWDKNGYCLLYKRLHRALFALPNARQASDTSLQIDSAALQELLVGVAQEKREKRTKTTQRLH